MPKLSLAAARYLMDVIETTPYGRVIVEINENSPDVAIIVEGRVKFPKPNGEPKPGQMAFENQTKKG